MGLERASQADRYQVWLRHTKLRLLHCSRKWESCALLWRNDRRSRWQQVTTIEGLSEDNQHPVQRAWAEIDVPQCGYCQPGFIMATAAFLKIVPEPEDPMIDRLLTNICRCGTYNQVRAAVHRAAEIQKEEA